MVFMSGFSLAQELGGAGGSSGNSGKAVDMATMDRGDQRISARYALTTIEVGSPEISAEEGIFIWLDESQTWQVRWQGAPGQFVWVRLMAENPISDVITMGEGVKAEMREKAVLVITATTTSEPSGVSFKSETLNMDLDAKWNMVRDSNKVNISDQKVKPLSLPAGIKASIYKDKGMRVFDTAANDTGDGITPMTSSGAISSGGGYGASTQ